MQGLQFYLAMSQGDRYAITVAFARCLMDDHFKRRLIETTPVPASF